MNFVFDFFQNAQAFLHTRSAKAANRSAVGFVVAGFEDERKAERPRHALNDLGHAHSVLFALDHARAGDKKKIARPDADIADLEGIGKTHLNYFTTESSEAQRENNINWSSLRPRRFCGEFNPYLSARYFFRPMKHLDRGSLFSARRFEPCSYAAPIND